MTNVLKCIEHDYNQKSCQCSLCGEHFNAKGDAHVLAIFSKEYDGGVLPVCHTCAKVSNLKEIFYKLTARASLLNKKAECIKSAAVAVLDEIRAGSSTAEDVGDDCSAYLDTVLFGTTKKSFNND